MNAAPATIPTLRAATPVSSVTDTLDGAVVFGTVPARPHSRFADSAAATVPCTDRKSTARGRRQDTR